ncbi:antibiotic resistance protein VanZ [Deinococcus sonorensis]|uniref:Antibiotic resistance protein VanZ n=2 Tax=Deinococcus sonorensis TaxID=309891 RepID=A0AAU7UDT6_9DEIO
MRPLWGLLSLGVLAGLWWLETTGPVLTGWPGWLIHAFVYLLLGLTLARATGSRTAGWVLAAWVGALNEVMRAFLPGHEAGITGWWFALGGSWLGSRGVRRPRRLPQDEPWPPEPA